MIYIILAGDQIMSVKCLAEKSNVIYTIKINQY